MGSKPKTPAKTAEEAALERRQRSMLDDEIAETEELFKLQATRRLGSKSLLAGAPTTRRRAATRGGGSMMSGLSSGSVGGRGGSSGGGSTGGGGSPSSGAIK